MASPHGSSGRQWLRKLALRFLSDAQRKRLKAVFQAVQSVPRRLLGVQSLYEAQRAEIGRLKAKVGVLEGKLNLALYGLPAPSPDAAVALSTQPLLAALEAPDLPPAARPDLQMLGQAVSVTGTVLAAADFGAVEGNAIAVAVKASAVLEADPSGSLKTDLVSALLAREDGSAQAVLCLLRFQRLSPLEQEGLPALAARKLAAHGVLYLELPALENPEVARDLYWRDPGTLRPYSLSRLQEALKALPGEVSIVGRSDGRKTFGLLFRKRSD